MPEVDASGALAEVFSLTLLVHPVAHSGAARLDPQRFVMVGNSLRSDILPVLDLGGVAVYIPYEHTWSHENSQLAEGPNAYCELENLGQLPGLLARLEERSYGIPSSGYK